MYSAHTVWIPGGPAAGDHRLRASRGTGAPATPRNIIIFSRNQDHVGISGSTIQYEEPVSEHIGDHIDISGSTIQYE